MVIFFLKKNLTEIFWNGQVCNEEDGGVCCKKNYELTNGVVVKIKKIVLHLIIQTTKITMIVHRIVVRAAEF